MNLKIYFSIIFLFPIIGSLITDRVFKGISKLFSGVTVWWAGLVGLHFSSLDWWAGLVGQQFQTEFKKRQVDVCLERTLVYLNEHSLPPINSTAVNAVITDKEYFNRLK